MNTYIITARYRFDVIHYLVKAETEEEAEKIISHAYDGMPDDDCEDLPCVKKKCAQVLDLSIEYNELDDGSKYFDSDGCIYEFHIYIWGKKAVNKLLKHEEFNKPELVYGKENDRMSFVNETGFDTKEEAEVVVNKILHILGKGYKAKFEKGRAFGWYITKE